MNENDEMLSALDDAIRSQERLYQATVNAELAVRAFMRGERDIPLSGAVFDRCQRYAEASERTNLVNDDLIDAMRRAADQQKLRITARARTALSIDQRAELERLIATADERNCRIALTTPARRGPLQLFDGRRILRQAQQNVARQIALRPELRNRVSQHGRDEMVGREQARLQKVLKLHGKIVAGDVTTGTVVYLVGRPFDALDPNDKPDAPSRSSQ
jgi:hypothetical protein